MNNEELEDKLIELKRLIEEAKPKASERKGRKQYLEQQLKDDWSCSSKGEAQKKIKSLQEEYDEFNKKIQEGMKQLTIKYNLNEIL